MHFYPGRKITIACILIAVVVVLLGAFTRLSHAGLGCPDWPTCYGHLWVPNSAAEIATANLSFAHTPVETDKTWPEQIHRIFASSLGVFIIALVVACYRNRREQLQPLKLSYLLLVLVIVQGLFGMWTVTLKLWPQVVTAHLLGGFSTLALLWLMLQRLSLYSWSQTGQSARTITSVSRLALFSLLVVIIQIFLGGWISSNYAALACPDLPMCQDQWFPTANFSQGFNFLQHIGPNYLGGLLDNEARIAIHISHRIGAIITSIVLLLLAWRLWHLAPGKPQRWSLILIAVLALQIGLGLSNVYWSLPLTVAVIHNGIGALLLLVLVTINHRLWGLDRIMKKIIERSENSKVVL